MAKIRSFNRAIRGKKGLCWAVGAAFVLVFPLLYQALVELLQLGSGRFLLEYLWLRRAALVPGYLVLLALFALVTIATRRPWVANLTLGAFFLVFGCANYYKTVFRGEPLMPRDIVQTGEALAISGEVHLYITREMIIFLVLLIVTTVLLFPFRLPFKPGWKSLTARILAPVLCAAFIPGFIFGYMSDKTAMALRHGVSLNQAQMKQTYYMGTALTSFCYLLANLWQSAPDGYSQSRMEDIAAELESSGEEQPDIVVVLLESFYDVTAIEGTSYSEELMPNYNRLAQEGVAGNMLVDKRGGGTSDYEFMVLTGFSTSYLPVGSVPYIEYVDDGFPSLASYCRESGYETIAIHPYYENFYDRNKAYPNMGFNQFLSLEDFDEEADRLGNYVSDDALARRIIQEYEDATAGGDPVMVHSVTMQNHTPYDPGTYPEDYAVQATSGQGEYFDASLSTMATGIRDMDAFMGTLTDYFRESDRDVVLLFFGDHQTGVTDEEYVDLVTLTNAYGQADEIGRWTMTHTTPYLMWANYQTAGAPGQTLAPYMLLPYLFRTYNVQGPAWYHWLAEGLAGSGGTIVGYDILPDGSLGATSPDSERALAQQLLQYDAMFGKGYALQAMYGTAA